MNYSFNWKKIHPILSIYKMSLPYSTSLEPQYYAARITFCRSVLQKHSAIDDVSKIEVQHWGSKLFEFKFYQSVGRTLWSSSLGSPIVGSPNLNPLDFFLGFISYIIYIFGKNNVNMSQYRAPVLTSIIREECFNTIRLFVWGFLKSHQELD